MALILSRKIGETILIGDEIEIRLDEVKGKRAEISIVAPREVRVVRGELDKDVARTQQEA